VWALMDTEITVLHMGDWIARLTWITASPHNNSPILLSGLARRNSHF